MCFCALLVLVPYDSLSVYYIYNKIFCQISMKIGIDIHGPQSMIPNVFVTL